MFVCVRVRVQKFELKREREKLRVYISHSVFVREDKGYCDRVCVRVYEREREFIHLLEWELKCVCVRERERRRERESGCA